MKQRFFKIFDGDHPGIDGVSNSNSIPSKVRIRTRHIEDKIFVDTSGDKWTHERYCKMDWGKCRLDSKLKDAMRRFIWYRLASNSPSTANINFNALMSIQ